jgi:hypothetical protein
LYSKKLLLRHNINIKNPLTTDTKEPINKKSFSVDIDNSFVIAPTSPEENSSDEKIIKRNNSNNI